MYKDTKEELERLQEELLAEEVPEEIPQEEIPDEEDILTEEVLDELLDTDFRSYNTDNTDLDPEELSQQLDQPSEASYTGLIITAGALTFGIFLVALWWLLRYGGLL